MSARTRRRIMLAGWVSLATIVWAFTFIVIPTLGLLILIVTGAIAIWLKLRRAHL